MTLSAISSRTTSAAATPSVPSQIANLEKQLNQLRRAVSDVTRDSSLDPTTKQEQVTSLEAQVILLQSRIGRLDVQQAQAAQKRLTAVDASRRAGATPRLDEDPPVPWRADDATSAHVVA